MEILVFGTQMCPQCKVVKNFLEGMDVAFTYKTVGVDVTKEDVEQAAGREVRSVPVILFDRKEVTFSELKGRVETIKLQDQH